MSSAQPAPAVCRMTKRPSSPLGGGGSDSTHRDARLWALSQARRMSCAPSGHHPPLFKLHSLHISQYQCFSGRGRVRVLAHRPRPARICKDTRLRLRPYIGVHQARRLPARSEKEIGVLSPQSRRGRCGSRYALRVSACILCNGVQLGVWWDWWHWLEGTANGAN